jgi:hypothetical protein
MKTLVRDAAARAANLTPFQTDTYPLRGLTGNYAAVCTPVETVPAELQAAHLERHNAYMASEGRMTPGHGPRYYVTSRGVLVAWVTLDGTAHYATDEAIRNATYYPALPMRHREMIRKAWGTRVAVTSD